MCGIIGYIGPNNGVPVVLEGLVSLLPRGYDSGGIGLFVDGQMVIEKDKLQDGNYEDFRTQVEAHRYVSKNVTGHLRWATHGEPCKRNAHPQTDASGRIAVVHNGIIENYRGLKKLITEQYGIELTSDTDTELIAHLFSIMYESTGGDVRKAVLGTVNSLEGAFAIVIQIADQPTTMIGIRMGSPLSYTKLPDGGSLFASTAEPFLKYSRKGKHLSDGEIVIISNGTISELTFDDKDLTIPTVDLEGSPESVQKEGYPFFMEKEIMTQPDRLRDVLRGRVIPEMGDIKLGGLEEVLPKLLEAKHFFFIGSGTSHHAAMIIARMFREYLNVHAEAKLASEIVSDNILAGSDPKQTAVFCISQSGETADLIAAMKEMRRREVGLLLGIVNVVGSTIARMSDAGVYLHVGPEMGVASTKAFSAQVLVGAMITLLLARKKGMTQERGFEFAQAILAVPGQIATVLEQKNLIKQIVDEQILGKSAVMVLGRGYHFPSALEGALKIIEVGYMLREVQPAGEMKHGPIAIIDPGFPVLIIATKYLHEYVYSNISELKSRGAHVIGICTDGDTAMMEHVHEHLVIPEAPPPLAAILAVVVLQLFAYYIGVGRGNNVDQPKNLAKSVTVL